jgi:hypothetical protein
MNMCVRSLALFVTPTPFSRSRSFHVLIQVLKSVPSEGWMCNSLHSFNRETKVTDKGMKEVQGGKKA